MDPLQLVIGILVFCLLWLAIGVLPLPAPTEPSARPRLGRAVLYLLLIVAAVFWLVTRYGL